MPPSSLIRLPFLFKRPGSVLDCSPLRHVPITPTRSLRKPARAPAAATTRTIPKPKTKSGQKSTRRVIAPDFTGINFYEQDGTGRKAKRRRVSPPSQGGLSALDGLERTVDEQLRELEERDDTIETTAPESLKKELFTDEERERIGNLLLQSGKEIAKMPHRVPISNDISNSSRLFLRKLNDCLDAASTSPSDEEARRDLWRYYERSKIYIPDLVQRLPDEAWKLLWLSQSEDKPTNAGRALHLKILGQDMADAGKTLTMAQRLAHMEGLFWEGHREDAFVQWESGLQEGSGGDADYLELGIKMYAYERKISRAAELLDVLFALHSARSARIVQPVISASIGRWTDEGYREAWEVYSRFRDRISSDFIMDDYDTISVDFLRGGQKDLAFAVFRDMMLRADKHVPIGALHSTAIERMESLMSMSETAGELNTLGLDSLTFLPRRFQNKFFYASWMKKLIGMGETEGAEQVMELMWERGVKPDAKHVNGLVGAWLRGTQKPAQAKAEALAWKMIQARLDFVRARDIVSTTAANEDSSTAPPTQTIHDNQELSDLPSISTGPPAPAATIETFSLLIQHYLRRSKFQHVRHLRNLLVPCAIPMNSYIMNHLLYAELRNRTHRDAWARFEVMSRSVAPDLETFAVLWQCMKAHVDTTSNSDFSGFPSPRQLFLRMTTWLHSLPPGQYAQAIADMDQALHDEIVRCFCLSRDLEGTFVALHTLHTLLASPTMPPTIRMLTMQVARLGERIPWDNTQAARLRRSRRVQHKTMGAASVFEAIVTQRQERMAAAGKPFEQLDDAEKLLERHGAVLQFLHRVIAQGGVDDEEVDAQAAINEAAESMGVEAIDVDAACALLV